MDKGQGVVRTCESLGPLLPALETRAEGSGRFSCRGAALPRHAQDPTCRMELAVRPASHRSGRLLVRTLIWKRQDGLSGLVPCKEQGWAGVPHPLLIGREGFSGQVS